MYKKKYTNETKENRKNNLVTIMIITLLMSIIFCIVFVLGKVYDNSSKNHISDKIEDQLNVAIVNEDSGVYKGHQLYQLGNQYVNQLEDTKNKKYKVVSRGIAENGLKEKSYQLVLFIPSTFSEQILEINRTNPEKLPIQYKIEAKNKTEKDLAEKEANALIKDLNQRLIDMYTIGIMDNLYSAQKNVAGIYDRQGKLMTNYEKELSNPIKLLQSNYPKFSEWTKNVNKQNENMKKTMNDFGDGIVDETKMMIDNATKPLIEQITEQDNLYKTQLQSAETKHQEELNNKNNSLQEQYDLFERMMGEKEENLKATISELTLEIEENQKVLEDTVKTDNSQTGDDVLKEFNKYSKAYEEELIKLEKEFKKEKEDIKDEIEAVKDKTSSDDEGYPQLTVEDYLRETDKELYDKLKKYLSSAELLEEQLSMLPVMDPNLLVGFTDEEKQKIGKLISELNSNIQLLNDKNIFVQYNPSFETQETWNKYIESIDKNNKVYNQEVTQIIDVSNLEGLGDFKDDMSIEIKLHKESYKLGDIQKENPDAKLKLEDLGNNIYKIKFEELPKNLKIPVIYKLKDAKEDSNLLELSYKCPEITEKLIVNGKESDLNSKSSKNNTKSSIKNSTNNTSSSTNGPIIDEKGITHSAKNISVQIPVDYSKAKESINDIVNNQTNLSHKRQEYIELYKKAVFLSQERIKEAEEGIVEDLLNIDLNNAEYLMVIATLSDSSNRYEEALESIKEKQQVIEKLKEDYINKLPEYTNNNENVVEKINQVLASLKTIQENMNNLSFNAEELPSYNEDSSNDSVKDTNDQKYVSAKEELAKLETDTESIENLTKVNADQFDMVSDELQSLGKDLENIEKSSKDINNNANKLQDDFKKELSKSGDFAKSFIKVLNAGYKDGVPNEQLINFISNPLSTKGKTNVKDKAKVYQTGLWIMIIIVLSIFISGIVWKSKFKLIENYFSNYEDRINRHIFKLIILTIFGIIAGYIISKVSYNPLDISMNYQGIWTVQMIVMMLMSIYMSYIFMNYLDIYGLGIQTIFVLLFIFNMAKPINITILNKINVYEHLNSNIVLMISQNPRAFLGVAVMIMVTILLGLMIVFVPNYKELKKQ